MEPSERIKMNRKFLLEPLDLAIENNKKRVDAAKAMGQCSTRVTMAALDLQVAMGSSRKTIDAMACQELDNTQTSISQRKIDTHLDTKKRNLQWLSAGLSFGSGVLTLGGVSGSVAGMITNSKILQDASKLVAPAGQAMNSFASGTDSVAKTVDSGNQASHELHGHLGQVAKTQHEALMQAKLQADRQVDSMNNAKIQRQKEESELKVALARMASN